MPDPINIREPLQEICQRLGLVYENVKRIRFHPQTIIADVYLTNDEGKKYVRVNEDGEQEAAFESLTFKVST